MTKGWTVIRWRADLPPVAVGTKLYTAPPAPAPLTDEQLTKAVLADETLRYYFAINGGTGPVSAKGFKVFRAVERAIRGEKP